MDIVLQSVSKQVEYICEMEQLLDIVDSLPESQMNVFNYDAQIVRLKEDIERYKQLDEVLTLDNKWLAAMREAEDKTGVDSDLVKHLVKAVKIYEEKRVEVELNFSEQKQVMERIIGEMMGEDSDE